MSAVAQEQVNRYHTRGEKPEGVNREERRRFELASEFTSDPEFAAGALHTLRDGWEELRETDPDFYVGLTVHGSMVKGRAHTYSDIDATVFYNPDAPSAQAARKEIVDRFTRQHPETAAKDPDMAKLWAGQAPDSMVNNGLKTVIRPRLKAAGYGENISGPVANGSYHRRPMNERLLTMYIATADDRVAKHRMHPTVEAYSEDNQVTDEAVVDLFAMRVGSGKIKQYRRYLLDGLSATEHGETVWSRLAATLVASEEHIDRRNATIYFPRTLADAYDYFHIDPPKQGEVSPAEVSLQALKAERAAAAPASAARRRGLGGSIGRIAGKLAGRR